MHFVMFYHSLVSDWNHGNAHFLRGVVSELLRRGHTVSVYEPRDGWSLTNLKQDQGTAPLREFYEVYPQLSSTFYTLETLDLDAALAGADVVLVHEWNDHQLVARIGRHRAASADYRLLFHDTHHRSVTARASMSAYDLSHYDGVLAFGQVIRDLYLDEGWAAQAWTWHEAADTYLFRPLPRSESELAGDLVWVGNWGDEERTRELNEFLLRPVTDLKLKTRVHGVRYPQSALAALAAAGIEYAGWLPNYRAAEAFARYRATVHIPRRPYHEVLPGIPTIRVFEALACGIPLVSLAWDDIEGLFSPGDDYLVVRTRREMNAALDLLRNDRDTAHKLTEHGQQTILARHTCAHRVDQLLEILQELGINSSVSPSPFPPDDAITMVSSTRKV